MNQPDIVRTLERIFLTRKEASDSGKLLAYARETNLAPEILRKFAHVRNQGYSIHDTNSSVDARGGTFDLINPDELVNEYTAIQLPDSVKIACAQAAPSVVRHAGLPPAKAEVVKEAATEASVVEESYDIEFPEEGDGIKVAGMLRGAFESQLSEKIANVNLLMSDIYNYHARPNYTKWASIVETVSDATADKYASIIEKIEDRMANEGLPFTTFNAANRQYNPACYYDETGILPLLEKASAAIEERDDLLLDIEVFSKESAFAAAKTLQGILTKSMERKQEIEDRRKELQKEYEKTINKEKAETRSIAAQDSLAMQMVGDNDLSKAEAEATRRIMDVIQRLAPTSVANDPTLMQQVVNEGVAYQGTMPLHSAQALAKLEETYTKNQDNGR